MKNSSPQSGFAIGLILLTIVLIGAIVAAISLSTRESAGTATNDQLRIQAQSVIQQANTIRQAIQLYVGQTGDNSPTFDDLINNGYLPSRPNPYDALGSNYLGNPAAAAWSNSWQIDVNANAAGKVILYNLPSNNIDANNICAQINAILYKLPSGTARAGTPRTSTGGSLQTGDFAYLANNNLDILPDTIRPGIELEGCVAHTPGMGTYHFRYR